MQDPSSKFIKVRCSNCKNEQIIFGKPSSKINCLVCSTSLADTTGGKGKIKTQILEVLE
ncbi:30S ribosomal protein S27e [Candidatus Woesearchaeota archaeon]|nr:30S ribosomal protein S27e [Candidatus Woesearchaeota archaeon]